MLQTTSFIPRVGGVLHVQHRGRLLSRHESDRRSVAHVPQRGGQYMFTSWDNNDNDDDNDDIYENCNIDAMKIMITVMIQD